MFTPLGIEFLRPGEHSTVRDLCRRPGNETSVLLIEGEAGIGKSTLLHHGVAEAARSGHRVLRSAAVPAERDQPYSGLLDLLAGVTGETWPDLPEPQRDALEVLLQRRPGDVRGFAPQTVGMALLSVLRRHARQTPTLVALDNLQWLDDASLDALSFAARNLDGAPVLVAATVRTSAPGAVLDPADLTPQPPRPEVLQVETRRLLSLRDLDARQVRDLLYAAYDVTLSLPDADRVRRWTRGNTFWVLQLGAEMAGRWQPGDDLPVPKLALTVARRWVDTAPSETVEAVVAVAAAGRLPVHSAVAALQPVVDDAGAALDDTVVAGLVVEEDGHLRPASPLFGEAARLAIPPVRRAGMHRRLGALSTDLHRRAKHLSLAAGGGPDEEAAAAMEAAAVSAAVHGDTRLAGELAAAAVELTPPSDGSAVVSRRVLAAEFLTCAAAPDRAWDLLSPVDPAGLDEELAERAVPLLAELHTVRGETAAARGLVAGVLEHAPRRGPRRVLALSLAAHWRYGDTDRLAMAVEAVGEADRSGASPAVTHRALRVLVLSRAEAGAGIEEDLLVRLRQIESETGHRRTHTGADALLGMVSRFDERLDRSRTLLRQSLIRASERGEQDGVAALRVQLADADLLAGDAEAAWSALDQERAAADRGEPLPYLSAVVLGNLLVSRCRLKAARALVEAQAAVVAGPLDAIPSRDRLAVLYLRGLVAHRAGESDIAVSELLAARAEADALGIHEPGARFRLDSELAETLIRAERFEAALEIAADHTVRGETRPVMAGVAARIEGMVAMAQGDLGTAADRIRVAVTVHEDSPIPGELGRSLLALSRVERRRRSRRAAQEALERAAEVFTAIGDRCHAGQVATELDRLVGRGSSHLLTEVERKVAELLAGGATTRGAASQLFVSVRTVETHVTAIYRKLGVRSRAELARAVVTDQPG
ncbi:helix-turn-helix transcriptional regulator [Jidongwangia harbinensis]|uniref:helix-turn-helix transcriptional regulator n=1 Tax=Jidongwangia harbinensis TaxID=2878561 RepID=UPI001CDA2A5D|nr:LuxR family transcriptional regulator [Jidongwangia harbinensis]MCA2218375.1 AAA family ATPase [Jidongwangia harbinensis]